MAIPGNMLSATTESIDPNTSGWVAKLNCAISLGAGGRNGDGTLKLTSSAAGEMQARTVSSYPVIPLTEYEALADASGATVPDRIGIRWLTSGGSEISITWSLTTATASATWHRIAVSGIAPSNAAKAHVVVSSLTPAGAGVIGAFENVYFGLPLRTASNLLTFNTETMERDLTGWVAETNCTISRQAPMVQWPVDYYLGGGQVAALTVTANGNAAMKVTEKPSATAGTEYLAYAYLNPPTSGSTTWVELRFYNSSDVQLTATRANLSAPGTGYYRQRVSAVAPATTAYATLAAGITTGTAAQVVRVDGAVIMPAPPLREGSVVLDADGSFEAGVAGWTVVSGVATLARLTPWGTDALEGSYCMTVSSATATTSVIRSAKFQVGAAAGLAFTSEYGMKVSAGGWTLTRAIRWYSATNVDLGTTAGTAAAVPSPNWWLLSAQFIAPAGATQAAIEWTLAATAVSSVLRVDKVSLWQSLPLIEAQTHDEDAYITLTLRELPDDVTLTVWRVGADGSRTLVRGTNGLIQSELMTSDVLVIEDYEAPLGVALSYYAEGRDSTGALVATRSVSSTGLDAGDTQYAWLKDVGNPMRNVRVMMATPPSWQRPIEQSKQRARGSQYPVVRSGVRQAREGELSVYTQSDEERQQLDYLLDPGSIILWQAAPGHGVSDMYLSIGPSQETPGGGIATDPLRTWTLPITQHAMPVALGVSSSAGRTGYDVLAENLTGYEVLDRYASGEDLLFGRRI